MNTPRIRPAGSGNLSACGAFSRPAVSPFAALVFLVGDETDPADWPNTTAGRLAECQLGHAAGWTCEVRKEDVVLLDPLGEGILKGALPQLTPAWKNQVRSTSSAAVYLVPAASVGNQLDDLEPGSAGWAMNALKLPAAPVRAASVRTAISPDVDAAPKLGRNDRCHCGSGKKFKACHGKAG